MDHDVRLERLGSRPLAVVRRRATRQELPSVIPPACGLVWNFVRDQKVAGAGRLVALFRDEVFNLEVGVELETPIVGQGEVVGSTTPAGPVATTTHFGPYERLPEAHRAVRDWCADHGYDLAGPFWEVYGHWVDEWKSNPAEIRTDVFYLLKEDGAFDNGPSLT